MPLAAALPARPPRRTPLIEFTTALLLLSACNGGGDGRGEATAPLLAPPSSTLADGARCDGPPPAGEALVTYRRGADGQCHQAFGGIATAPPLAAAAAAPSRVVTATELFDWAERTLPQYFPSARPDQTLSPYVYRYYPESQNHAAVSGETVYVQGPITGGALLMVGTLTQLSCVVDPSLCGGPRPCAAPASWQAGGRTCTPNGGQPGQLASGSTYTYSDSIGATAGAATYRCSDGTLTPQGNASCEAVPPRACNTASLSWTVGGQTCTPNAGEPTQIAHGSSHSFADSVQTHGSATFGCDNGLLFGSGGAPTCQAPAAGACVPASLVSWTAGGNLCVADSVPADVANGTSYTFTDTVGPALGSARYTCRAAVLEREGDAECRSTVQILDSFGGDAGGADGSASGDGTAADGAPIVGGLVRVVDLQGRSASATTDESGYFRVKLTGMQPPLLVSVTRGDGRVRRSLSLQPLRTNGFVFVAVTGLTDKIVSDLAAAAGFRSPAALTPAMLDNLRAGVAVAVEALRRNPLVRARVQAAGLDPDRFDPLHTPFRADGRGYDAVLDQLLVDSDESGATVIRAADCTAPASWTVDGATCTPDAGAETVVPSGSTIVHRDTQGLTRGSVGWQCTKGVLSKPILASCTSGGG